jgi:hypothetical protein
MAVLIADERVWDQHVPDHTLGILSTISELRAVGMKCMFVSLVLFNQSFKALNGPLVEQHS